MPAFSDYAESGILNFLFRSNTNSFGAPANVSVALCTDVPSESQNGTTIPEVPEGAANGYNRVNLGAPANADWDESDQVNDSGHIQNAAAVTFGAATTAWGNVSGIALVTNQGWGSGEVLMFGALTTPKDVGAGDTFQFNTGELDLYLG